MTRFEATVGITDNGFFEPRTELPHHLVETDRFRVVPLEGLPESLQFVRTRVAPASDEVADHLVLWAHFPRLEDTVLEACAGVIANAFPDAPVTFVLDVAFTSLANRVEIETQIRTYLPGAGRHGVAAACATLCWGTLAEVERVTVRSAGRVYVAQMRSDSDAWYITVG